MYDRGNTRELIKSYLDDRKPIIHYNDTISIPLWNTVGVPQGSKFSPLLTNNLHYYLNEVMATQHADDSSLYLALSKLCCN